MLESGPAAAVMAIPRPMVTSRRKRAGFTGTGLAQPNGIPASGRRMVPEQVDVRQRVEREPPLARGGVVPELPRAPGVGELVDRQRKDDDRQEREPCQSAFEREQGGAPSKERWCSSAAPGGQRGTGRRKAPSPTPGSAASGPRVEPVVEPARLGACRRGCRSAWWPRRRARAWPAPRAGRRRPPAGGWRRSGGACGARSAAGSRPPGRGGRAAWRSRGGSSGRRAA